MLSSAPRGIVWETRTSSRGPERRGRARPGDLGDAGLRRGLPRLVLPDPRVPRVWTTLSLFLSLPPAAWARANLLRSHFQRKVSAFFPAARPAPWSGSGPAGRPRTPRASGSGSRPSTATPGPRRLPSTSPRPRAALGGAAPCPDAPRQLRPGRFGAPGLSPWWGGPRRPEGPPQRPAGRDESHPGTLLAAPPPYDIILWRPFSPFSLPRVPDASAGPGGHFVRAGGAGWHGAGAGGAAGGGLSGLRGVQRAPAGRPWLPLALRTPGGTGAGKNRLKIPTRLASPPPSPVPSNVKCVNATRGGGRLKITCCLHLEQILGSSNSQARASARLPGRPASAAAVGGPGGELGRKLGGHMGPG